MFYSNFAALGLRRDRAPDSLFNSAASPDSELRVRSVTLTTHDTSGPESPARGHRIDADSLDDA